MSASTVTDLNAANLGSLAVPVPSYDRSAVTVGIVHFGVGGFHRAHQAMYVDRLLERGLGSEWGICGVGVMPSDQRMRDVMRAQDCLYTLVVKDPSSGWQPKVIGSIVDYLYAPDDPEAVIELMAAPTTRIVSMTVTEGGYNFSPVTGKFDADNPAVRADLQLGAVPATTFGLVTEALSRRRDRGLEPFTVISWGNLPGKGPMAKGVFPAFAGLPRPRPRRGVGEPVPFPNPVVGPNPPGPPDPRRAEIAERFGLADAWP